MSVYFVQHGLSLSKDKNPIRPLSKEGIKQTKLIAKRAKKMGIKVSKVYHSGKERAKETAQILSNNLSNGTTEEKSNMKPNDNAVEFSKSLTEDNTMYVGHLPHLNRVLSYLLTGDEDKSIIEVKNSGIICLDKKEDKYQLKWYILS